MANMLSNICVLTPPAIGGEISIHLVSIHHVSIHLIVQQIVAIFTCLPFYFKVLSGDDDDESGETSGQAKQ